MRAELYQDIATDEELLNLPDEAFDENEEGEEGGLYEHFNVTVDKGQSLLRLDKFLKARMERSSRNRIQAAIDAGNVLVNGGATKSSYTEFDLHGINTETRAQFRLPGQIQGRSRPRKR